MAIQHSIMFRLTRFSGLVLQVFLLIILHNYKTTGQWVAPDAWGRATQDNVEIVPAVQSSSATVNPSDNCDTNRKDRESELAALFYSKLVKFIFDRNRMKFDPDEEVFSRAIVFKATPRELERLEQSNSPREWDSVLSELLPKSKAPDQIFQNDLLNDMFVSAKQLFKDFLVSTEIQFGLLAILVVLALIYLKREYKYGIVATICVGSFAFGLVHAYYDCNKELEISEYIDALHGKQNPCDYIEQSATVFSWDYFFRRYSKQDCIEYLKNKDKIKMPYCRPDQVLLKYINELFFEQMFIFADKSTGIFSRFSELGFPYNLMAMFIFGIALVKIVELAFKHIFGPMVWKQWRVPSVAGDRRHSKIGDQLSGENLKLFLETVKQKDQAQAELAKITPLVITKESIKETQLPQLTASKDIEKESSPSDNEPKVVDSSDQKAQLSDGEDEVIVSNGKRTSSVEEVP